MTFANCPKCGASDVTTAGVCANCGWTRFPQVTVSSGVYETIGELEIKMSGKALLDDYKRLLFENNKLTARIAELDAAHRWRVVANGELPKNNDYYWAHDDLGQQGMILFYDGEWNKFTNLSYITHWMLLPEPPNDTQTQTFVYGKESNEE